MDISIAYDSVEIIGDGAFEDCVSYIFKGETKE